MNKHLRFIIFFLFVIGSGIQSMAQTAFASEDELKQQATKLFDDDEFEEAYPLYSQLVSIYPKDPNYNYRLGVCMLYASDDKEKPIPFLEFAAKSPEVDKEVLFYLAKAYHLNYRFDDAITKYMEYEKVASSAKAEKLQVEHQIEMCRNGKKLLRNITDLVVIDKKELSRADFYRAYDISDIGGKLLAKPDEDVFKTSLDKKKKEKSIIYLSSNNNQVYFSSYGDDASHGKDIYVIRKLPNGEWSKPQTLGYPVNTEYDEDYPFLHPNGKVLYFCSKGHNSMGGYDIFKTTLNEETNTWNKPVNLDFPINTPDDDILYVTNDDEKEAFFSSARSSKTGKTAVYHINVERKPIDVAIIKGMVVRNRDSQALDVKITVKDLGDNTILGIYNSKAETGGYLINLPNGGKFMYTVEAAGFSTQSDVVILPTQYVFKPLKQEISYEIGTDKLIITNKFDEPVDDQSYLQALAFIKEKSKLDAGINNDANVAAAAKTDNSSADGTQNPGDNTLAKTDDTSVKTADNASGDNGTSPDNTTKSNGTNPNGTKTATTKPNGTKTAATTAKTTTPPTQLSNNDIVKIAYDDAKDADKEAKDLQEQADIALNLANEKNELAQNKTKEAAQLTSDANSMTDNVKKQTVVDEANQAREEEEELNQETVAAFNIAKKLGLKAAAKNEEADLSMQYAKDLEAAVKSKNSTEAMAKLEDQEKKLEALSEQNGNAEPDNIVAGLKMDAGNKKRELDKAVQASADIKQEMQDNVTLMGTLQSDADKTKKDDLKKGLLDQIAGLKADNEQSQKDLDLNEQKVAKAQKEYNGIKNEMELVNNVVDKSKTGTNEEAAASVKSIDKSKLEQQVNEMKTNTATEAPVIKTNTTATSDHVKTKTDDVAVNETKTVPDNTTKSTDATTSAIDNTEVKTTDAGVNETKPNPDNTTKTTDATVDNSIKTDAAAVAADRVKQDEEKLAATDNITNEADRANAKTDVYKELVTSLNEELTQKEQDVKTEKDSNKKKALNTEIVALEKEVKAKQQEQKTAIASAEKLKQQGTVAETKAADNETKTSDAVVNETKSNPDNTVKTADNTTATDAGSAATTTASAGELNIGSVNETYESKLTDANNITNDVERENAKADVLKKWSGAIDAVVVKQKQEMAATSDPEMKTLLAKKISDAQKLSEDKQTQATASLDQAAALKNVAATTAAKTTDNTETKSADETSTPDHTTTKTGDVAVNETKTNPDNSTKPTNTEDQVKSSTTDTTVNETKTADAGSELTVVQQLDNAIADAEKSTTETQRERGKQEAYTAYISAENDALKAKQAALKTEKDKTKKKELSQEIATIQQELKEKQPLLDAENVKVKALDDQAALASDNTSGDNTDNTKANIQETATINYVNPAAANTAEKATAAQKQSDDLNKQAEDLKTQAATKTKQADKDVMYTQASELEKQADDKKMESVQLAADANVAEYNAGKNAIDQLAAASVQNKSDEIAMAEMMKDESKMYMDKAQKSKELAATVTSGDDKLEALEDANNNEKIALEKQKKATELYQKNNPGFVVKANADNATAAKTAPVAVNETKATDNVTTPDHTLKSTNNTTTPDHITSDVVVNESKSTPDHTLKSTDAATTPDNTKTTDAAVNETKSNPDNIVKTADNTTAAETKTDATTSITAAELNLGSVNEIYESKLADANNITNDVERENAKADVLKKWSAAIDAVVVKQKQEMAATSDPEMKALLAKKISDAQKLSDDKQTQATASLDQAAALKNVAATTAAKTADNTETKAADGTSTPDNTKTKTDDVAVNETKSNPDHTTKSTDATAPVADNTKSKAADAVVNETKPTPDHTVKSADTTTPVTDNTTSKTTDAAVNETTSSPDNATKSTAVTTPTTDNTKTKPVATTKILATTAVLEPNEKFERTSVSAYSASKPIPVNEKLPEGLVFKVQIGAFRNPISPEAFSGMKPITAETTSQGFTRYTAGLFTKFATADKVKTEIRDLGYKDAFVVAFLNGKRISITEAIGMSGEAGTAAVVATTPTETKTTPAVTTPENTTATVPVKSKPAVNPVDAAPSENVTTVSGLFYTVQVGVYSQPITAAKLHNIQPLYTEKTANGYLRYNTGIYNSVGHANEAKNIVVGMGVKDAFVTAYYQGKRISMAEAQTLEAQGSSVFSTAGGMNELPGKGEGRIKNQESGTSVEPKVEKSEKGKANSNQGALPVTEPVKNNGGVTNDTLPVAKSEQPTTTAEQPATIISEPAVTSTELKNTVAQNNTMPVDAGVVFKVQIGAFKDEVPLDIANEFLKIAGKGIKNYQDENGLTIYTVGNFKTYDEASQLRTEIAPVVKDAFIVAYNDGKKISIDEAKSLLNK